MDALFYFTLFGVAFLAVAHSHDRNGTNETNQEPVRKRPEPCNLQLVSGRDSCDCDGYTKCVVAKKAERYEQKTGCCQTCKVKLDPTIAAAMEKCRKNKNFEKFQCILDKTCITKTSSKKDGRNKWHKGKKLERIAALLPEDQAKTIADFRECIKECKEQKSSEESKESCRSQFPGCGFDFKGFVAAKEECKVTRKEDCCRCLIDELGIKDESVCERKHERKERSAEQFDDIDEDDII